MSRAILVPQPKRTEARQPAGCLFQHLLAGTASRCWNSKPAKRSWNEYGQVCMDRKDAARQGSESSPVHRGLDIELFRSPGKGRRRERRIERKIRA